MPAAIYSKLDNPAWYSLTETHKHFAIGDEEIKRYQPAIAPFVACISDKKDILSRLGQWVNRNESFFIIGHLPALPSGYIIETRLLCAQMICTEAIQIPAIAGIKKLDEKDEVKMTNLINLVQPGYYKPGTRLMGDYYGIHCDGKLVSITGERMCMDGFAEISAVVTHPAFTGRKYAQQLVLHAVHKNLAAGITPFLHVAETNERAIKLYKYLGFVQRRIIAFWKIRKE